MSDLEGAVIVELLPKDKPQLDLKLRLADGRPAVLSIDDGAWIMTVGYPPGFQPKLVTPDQHDDAAWVAVRWPVTSYS